jgi:hypothetical protein
MGKKQVKKQSHATMSFAQLAGKANQEALKPYILELFGNLANDLGHRQQVKLAILQNRIEALGNAVTAKTSVTQTDIETSLYDLEDKVTGYESVARPAQEGDLLRLTMTVKDIAGQYGEPQNREFSNLGREPYSLGVPTFEKALIGSIVGETLEIPMDEALQKATGASALKFTVNRISMKKDVPNTKESEDAKDSNAQEPSGSPEAGETNQA